MRRELTPPESARPDPARPCAATPAAGVRRPPAGRGLGRRRGRGIAAYNHYLAWLNANPHLSPSKYPAVRRRADDRRAHALPVVAYIVVSCCCLVFVAMPMRYIGDDPTLVKLIGPVHGLAYMVYLVVAFDLAVRAKWTSGRTALVLLAGTIPVMSFVAERKVGQGTATEHPRCGVHVTDTPNGSSYGKRRTGWRRCATMSAGGPPSGCTGTHQRGACGRNHMGSRHDGLRGLAAAVLAVISLAGLTSACTGDSGAIRPPSQPTATRRPRRRRSRSRSRSARTPGRGLPISTETPSADRRDDAEMSLTRPAGQKVRRFDTGGRHLLGADAPLAFSKTYEASVTAWTPTVRTETLRPRSPRWAAGRQTGTGLYLFDGHTYGVGMPVVVEFPSVTEQDRAGVQRRMFVKTDPPQPGAWSWANGTQAYYRAPDYWKPGTTISVRAAVGACRPATAGTATPTGRPRQHRAQHRDGRRQQDQADEGVQDGELVRTCRSAWASRAPRRRAARWSS